MPSLHLNILNLSLSRWGKGNRLERKKEEVEDQLRDLEVEHCLLQNRLKHKTEKIQKQLEENREDERRREAALAAVKLQVQGEIESIDAYTMAILFLEDLVWHKKSLWRLIRLEPMRMLQNKLSLIAAEGNRIIERGTLLCQDIVQKEGHCKECAQLAAGARQLLSGFLES